MAGVYDANVGLLTPGQLGWIGLDANNTPTASPGGNATVAKPAPGTKCAPVMSNVMASPADVLVTPTGAPLKTQMNPYLS